MRHVRGAGRHDSRSAAAASRCSRHLLSAFRQESPCVALCAPGPSCSTTAAARPIRSAARAARSPAIVTRGSIGWSDAVCTALQLTNFWQDCRSDCRPRAHLRAGRRSEQHGAVGRWRSSDLGAGGPRRRGVADAGAVRGGRPVCMRSAGVCVCDGARPGSAACAPAIASRRRVRRTLDRVSGRGSSDCDGRRLAADAPWLLGARTRWRDSRWAAIRASTMRSWSFRPKAARHHRRWDFCRAVDDAVDEAVCARAGAQPANRPRGCRVLAQGTRRSAMKVDSRRTEQARRCSRSSARSTCRAKRSTTLIDGVAMDLARRVIAPSTLCSSTAGGSRPTVGLICIRIFGYRSRDAREYAVNLGLALQLTNILRDIADDLARGRLYLPLEDLAVRLHERRPAKRAS